MRRALAIVVWLTAAQMALAAGIEAANQPALTLTLSQRERGPFDPAAYGFAAAQNPLEERLLADAADGRLDEFSPLGAALVAGGVEDADSLRQYEQKAAALADQLRHSVELAGAPRRRVEAIFDFMHRRVLHGGYDLVYTDLRRLLDQGRFNCISATVLFNYLAGQCGLECRGLEMPGHAMSRVLLPDRPLDVETTCPRWFSMTDQQKSRPLDIGSGTIGAAGAADRTKAREVSPIQMAAMIYYNRGVDLLSEKRFAEAAAANAKALRLDPRNATARGNLLATVNNWSIELGNRGQYAEAVGLLRQGLAMDAKFGAFAQNYVHIHHQWVDHLCQAGQFEEAFEILSRAAAEMPDRNYLRQAQSEVRERWARAVSPAPQSGPLLQFPCVKRHSPVD